MRKADDFDSRFDAGGDVTGDLDVTAVRRPAASERIQRAKNLRDSVAAETGALPLTVAQRTELDRRLDDLERDPGAGESWGTVRSRIERRWIGWGEFAPGWSFDPRRRSSGRRQRTAS